MPLPLSLEIIGTDRSHPEAGGRGADLIACRSVANDSPVRGRLSSQLASKLHAAPRNSRGAIFVLVVYWIYLRRLG